MAKKNNNGVPGNCRGNGIMKINNNVSQKIKLIFPLKKFLFPLKAGVRSKTAITRAKIKKKMTICSWLIII